jgi:hypothetical protein
LAVFDKNGLRPLFIKYSALLPAACFNRRREYAQGIELQMRCAHLKFGCI